MLTINRSRTNYRSLIRLISTETTISSSSNDAPPPYPATPRSARVRFGPNPRPSKSSAGSTSAPRKEFALPYLPPNFGQNQVLTVPDSTRALLEQITNSFNAPIQYAFAYGSGVFKQEGYSSTEPAPLLDFIFAVKHPAHWHSMNMAQNPSHYPFHARLFGSSFISRIQRVTPGVWFNAYVPINGVMIKYGVTTMDNLCSDLLGWDSLYLSGRMHKPIRIIKDNPRVRLTQQVNLVSAVRTALLQLPEHFDETELFQRIAQFSYRGDLRMSLPAENPEKVGNIVRAQGPQFRELYQRLANGLPGVHWATGSSSIQQDVSPRARAALVRKLPSNLLKRIEGKYASRFQDATYSPEQDASTFWLKVGADPKLSDVMDSEMSAIVKWPSTVQTAKGIVSAGLLKSIRYGATKVGKWWSSRS